MAVSQASRTKHCNTSTFPGFIFTIYISQQDLVSDVVWGLNAPLPFQTMTYDSQAFSCVVTLLLVCCQTALTHSKITSVNKTLKELIFTLPQ